MSNTNDTKKRKHFYLSQESMAVLNQMVTMDATTDSISNILDSLIISHGIELGILTVDEERKSIYEKKKIKTLYSDTQITFERLLNDTRREVKEFSQKTGQDVRNLEHRIADVEKIVYQIRDMLNCLMFFTMPDGGEFKSSDKSCENFEPHQFQKKSEQNYAKRQERLAVEKSNFGRGGK